MDPFEDTEVSTLKSEFCQPVKFTSMLRDRLRHQRGQEQIPVDTQTQLKLIAKRNVEIKRSFELSKQGIIVDVSAFEPEATLIFHLRLSTKNQLRNLYEELVGMSARFNRPLRISEDSQQARIFKYSLLASGELKKLPQTLEKDHYSFKQEFEKKQEEFQKSLKFLVQQIHMKRNEILNTDLENDFL